MKLRTRFFIWISSLLLIGILTVSSFMTFIEIRTLRAELHQSQRNLSIRLARASEEALYQSDLIFLNFVSTLKQERGFESASFVDNGGIIRLDSSPSRINKQWTANTSTLDLQEDVRVGQQIIGKSHLLFRPTEVNQFLWHEARNAMKRAALVALIVMLVGLIGAHLLAKSLARPIDAIVQGMKRVSSGKLDPIPAEPRSDEIGQLAVQLNDTIAKLRELDEMKRSFFSRITHELRSPLAGIRSMHTVLMNGLYGALSATQMEPLIAAQNNSGRLERLIDDLLTASKLEAHKEEFDFSEVDLVECCEEARNICAPIGQEKGVPAILKAAEPSVVAWADREKVLHVLVNLISNALKYTQKGSVSIEVSKNKTAAEVIVRDTGPGIIDEDKEKVFKKYFRSQSNSKAVKGTGLGLFISKELMESQNGNIWIEDNPGGGSIFRIRFPLVA